MDSFKFFLALHICGGITALIIAPLAMITVKGGGWHRRWGRIFFWAMAEVAVTAAILCWLRSGLFLFLIALFSFYLALTGYRALYRKNPDARPHVFDFLIAITMLVAGFSLIYLELVDRDKQLGLIPMIFGLIGLQLGGLDILRLVKPCRANKAWMLLHCTRFLSAYVAAVTAFSVVNFQFLPNFWRWLGPTILGTSCITALRIYYARKFKKESDVQ